MAAFPTLIGNLRMVGLLYAEDVKALPDKSRLRPMLTAIRRLFGMYLSRILILLLPVYITMWITLPPIVGPLFGLGRLLAIFIAVNASFTAVPFLEERLALSTKVGNAFKWLVHSTWGHILLLVTGGLSLLGALLLGIFYVYMKVVLFFSKPAWFRKDREAAAQYEASRRSAGKSGEAVPAEDEGNANEEHKDREATSPEQIQGADDQAAKLEDEKAIEQAAAVTFRDILKSITVKFSDLRRESRERGPLGLIKPQIDNLFNLLPFEVGIAFTFLILGTFHEPVRNVLGSEIFNASRFKALTGEVKTGGNFVDDFPETNPLELYEVQVPQLDNLSRRALGGDTSGLRAKRPDL